MVSGGASLFKFLTDTAPLYAKIADRQTHAGQRCLIAIKNDFAFELHRAINFWRKIRSTAGEGLNRFTKIVSGNRQLAIDLQRLGATTPAYSPSTFKSGREILPFTG